MKVICVDNLKGQLSLTIGKIYEGTFHELENPIIYLTNDKGISQLYQMKYSLGKDILNIFKEVK